MIEHNTHLIEYVDHVIDLDSTGGHGGGKLLASGKPEDIAKTKNRVCTNSCYQFATKRSKSSDSLNCATIRKYMTETNVKSAQYEQVAKTSSRYTEINVQYSNSS